MICQVRFPTILRIESELPANFQDRIRAKFPLFNESSSEGQIEIPQEIAKLLSRQLDVPGQNYNFVSEDRSWGVNLTRDFLALSCRKYERWERFLERLEIAMSALNDEYHPSFFSRVGLRYQNAIHRSRLDLSDKSWSQLLRTEIAGELGNDDFAKCIKIFKKDVQFVLADGTQTRMLNGLTKTKTTEEEVYVIDTDFFTTERTEVPDAWEKLKRFNEYARSIFRWSIADELHRAMGPKQIDGHR